MASPGGWCGRGRSLVDDRLVREDSGVAYGGLHRGREGRADTGAEATGTGTGARNQIARGVSAGRGGTAGTEEGVRNTGRQGGGGGRGEPERIGGGKRRGCSDFLSRGERYRASTGNLQGPTACRRRKAPGERKGLTGDREVENFPMGSRRTRGTAAEGTRIPASLRDGVHRGSCTHVATSRGERTLRSGESDCGGGEAKEYERN